MADRRTQPTPSTPGRGFTLVELLVVIGIIALLIAIFTPSVATVLKLAARARSVAAISELSSGALAYQQEHRYFPGQRSSNIGMGDDEFSGSQVLAASLFGLDMNKEDGPITPGERTMGLYVEFSEERVLDDSELEFHSVNPDISNSNHKKSFALSDRFADPRAILYYPSRIGNDGLAAKIDPNDPDDTDGAFNYYDCATTGQNIYLQNDATGSDRAKNWKAMLVRGDSADVVYKNDSFVLIGPGIDRTYFLTRSGINATDDNVTNYRE